MKMAPSLPGYFDLSITGFCNSDRIINPIELQ